MNSDIAASQLDLAARLKASDLEDVRIGPIMALPTILEELGADSQTAFALARIATVLRYDDPNVFSRAFRNWANLSPSQWRKPVGPKEPGVLFRAPPLAENTASQKPICEKAMLAVNLEKSLISGKMKRVPQHPAPTKRARLGGKPKNIIEPRRGPTTFPRLSALEFRPAD